MKTYLTKAGDMWDKIAFEQLGSEYYAPHLLRANPRLLHVLVFPANVEVQIPDIEQKLSKLPPWR